MRAILKVNFTSVDCEVAGQEFYLKLLLHVSLDTLLVLVEEDFLLNLSMGCFMVFAFI